MIPKAKISTSCIYCNHRCFEMVLLLETRRCRRLQLSLEFLHTDWKSLSVWVISSGAMIRSHTAPLWLQYNCVCSARLMNIMTDWWSCIRIQLQIYTSVTERFLILLPLNLWWDLANHFFTQEFVNTVHCDIQTVLKCTSRILRTWKNWDAMRQPADAYEYKPAIKKWVQKQPKLIYNIKQEFIDYWCTCACF